MQLPPPGFTIPSNPTPCDRTYWVIDKMLLAGAYPGKAEPAKHRERIRTLFDTGMRTFINLQEEGESNNNGEPFVRYDDELRMLAKKDGDRIAHLRFPIHDAGTPTVDRMRSILDAIDLSLESERPVYVHCFGGMGRTGTAVCCWLMRHGLATTENVLGILTKLRLADKERADWKAPENSKQESFVLHWNS